MAESITNLLDQIIARYAPGGGFGEGERALLKRAKTKSLAQTGQEMVTRGLAGTSAGAGAGQKWEEEIGMPAELRLEDIRSSRLTQALGAKAGYMERAETRTSAEEEAQRDRDAREFQALLQRQSIPSNADRGLDRYGRPLETAGYGPTGYSKEGGFVGGSGMVSGYGYGGGGGGAGGGGTTGYGTHVGASSFSLDDTGGVRNIAGGDRTFGQPVIGGPLEGHFALSGGGLSKGTMGGFQEPLPAQPAQVDTSLSAYRTFKASNPFYTKGYERWKQDRSG